MIESSFTKHISHRKATLKAFNSTNYRASVQLTGSLKAFLENIPVVRNIPAAEMVVGRNVEVVMFDSNNPKDAVITGVYT